MLPRSRRLNLKKDFKWVASGRKMETKYLNLFVKLGDNKKPKAGIAISAKYFKKATERNRARRLISAGLEAIFTKLPFNVNIVVLSKKGILDVKSQDVALDLKEKFKSEKIIH